MTDVVVPAHNEAPRIAAVLKAIRASPAVSNLIVVADACTDATVAIAATYGQVVEIEARDKGTAMATGLAEVTTERVVFCDADLSGFTWRHITGLCTFPPLAGQLVGVRDQLLARPFLWWPSISGERRLPTAFARRLALAGAGWRSETFINVAVAQAKLPHRQVLMRGVTNPSRRGLAGGIKELAQVTAASAVHSMSLARYVATED